MRKAILSSVLAVVLLHFLLGFVYPMFITGVGQVVFPGKANGSKIYRDGKLVGSANLAEEFGHPAIGKDGKPILTSTGAPTYNPDPRYFQPRPTAAAGYNAAATTFSNLGPNSRATLAEFDQNIHAYLALEGPYTPGLTRARIPVDAVQTSASGVDPDISVANADIQANRVAAVRHLPLSLVHKLISENTAGRWLGVLGEPGVNVVKLNLALDRQGQV